MRNRRRLKNILLNPRFQLKYVLLSAAGGLVVSLVNAAVFYIYTRENYTILVDLAPMDEQVKLQLYAELRQIVIYLCASSLAFVTGISVLALALSHRTAGPLYHFKRVFEEIKGGRLGSRIRLRPTDDFQEVAGAFNEMIDTLVAAPEEKRKAG